MALINCPECGHVVSDHAETCPNCGIRIAPAGVDVSNIKFDVSQGASDEIHVEPTDAVSVGQPVTPAAVEPVAPSQPVVNPSPSVTGQVRSSMEQARPAV